MPTTVNIQEAKSTLSRLLERTDVVFRTGAGQIIYDPDAFDRPDDEVVRLFDGS